MRIMLLAILCALLLNTTVAQTNISGILQTNGTAPAQGISLIVHSIKNKNKIIGYGFSDTKGNFNIKFSHLGDSIALSSHSLNYNDTTVFLINKSQRLIIELSYQINAIKEIKVKGAPIIVKNDTTTYMVSSFEKESDESIADVIARMPGFHVETDGKISYMGREIEKYYIEGMDLLENRYTIANKNLSNKDVGSVEVLHNHQPIKMLRGKKFRDGTSVNIKLKRKFTSAIRSSISVGIPFLRHYINTTPMLFSPKNQIIASLQSNNTGVNLAHQHRPIIFSTNEIDNISNIKTELLSIQSISPNFIRNEQRYLNNNANLISFNYLKKINKDANLKTNMSFYNDFINEKTNVTSNYYLNNNAFDVNEIIKNRFEKNSLITDFVYKQNASEQYINNKFRIENYWDNAKASINSSEQIERLYTPHFSLANETDTYKLIGKHFLSFKAFFDYNHSPQYKRYTPGVFATYINNDQPYKSANQHYSKDEARAKVSSAFSLKIKNWSFNTQIGINYDYNHLESSIRKDHSLVRSDSLQNKLYWHQTETYLSEGLRYEKPEFKLRLTFPISGLFYNIHDRFNISDTKIKRFFFSPRIYTNYKFFKYFSSMGLISYSKNLAGVDKITQGYIITNYRSLNKGINLLPAIENINLITRIEFKNPISGCFVSVKYVFSQKNSDILLNKTTLGNGIFQVKAITKNHQNISHNFTSELTYFNPMWQSSIGIKPSYLYSSSQYAINSNIISQKIHQRGMGLHVDVGLIRKLDIKYNFNFNSTNQKTPYSTTNYLTRQHVINFFYYPIKQHWFNIKCEYNYSMHSHDKLKTFFGDIGYFLKPNKGQLKYGVNIRNIFNAKTITEFNNSEFALIKSTYYLRPREILLNISYRF